MYSFTIMLFCYRKNTVADVDLAKDFIVSKLKKKNDTQKPRYTPQELLKGLLLFKDNQAILDNQEGSALTAEKKKKILNFIAQEMCAVSGVKRTGSEVLKRINSIRSKVKGQGNLNINIYA
jgi:hypothetical protein